MTHYKGADDETDKKEQALDVCMDGLEDPDTHLSQSIIRLVRHPTQPWADTRVVPFCLCFAVYRPSLTRRLTRLEKQLKLRPDECHVCEGELKTCETVVLAAKRIRPRGPDLKGDNDDDDDEQEELTAPRTARAKTADGEDGATKKTTWGAKSVWLGRDETEVGVEQWVLEQWEDKGWKG